MRRLKWDIPNIKGPLKSNEVKKYIDMYALCPCGSGNKYKFCCYGVEDKPFHNPNELYLYIINHQEDKSFCMYSNGDCDKEIIKAHSIQNNKILSKLASDGHVYIADFNQNMFGGVDLKKKGRNEATTATCFCKYHDTELFKDIELRKYQYEEKQNFLYAYRAFSKYYFDRIVGLEDTREMFKVSPNLMLSVGTAERIKGLEKSVEENDILKATFNAALQNEKFDEIQTITITLDYEVGFATAYMSPLSYDLVGNQISDVWSLSERMKNIYVSIFPENGKTYILISWLKEDSGLMFEELKKQFKEVENNKEILLRTLNNMVACHSDNVVFSKKLLDKWGEDIIKEFLSQYVSSFLAINGENIGLKIEENITKFKCKFNLFEHV